MYIKIRRNVIKNTKNTRNDKRIKKIILDESFTYGTAIFAAKLNSSI